MNVEFQIACRDASSFEADVLILKYVPQYVGLDDQIAKLLIARDLGRTAQLTPPRGFNSVVETKGALGARYVMVLGTFPIQSFDYDEVYRFGRRAVEGVAESGLDAAHVATTLHGVGFGLDAGECAQHLVNGFQEGLEAVRESSIRRITIIDRNPRVIAVVSRALERMGIAAHNLEDSQDESDPDARHPLKNPSQTGELGQRLRWPQAESPGWALTGESAAIERPSKSHVFVAMPFSEEFGDVYQFGIYAPVRAAGFVCERVDQAHFAGNIIARIKERIATAKFVIADLTGGRPNVYLEVGYAWGKDVPVVFLMKQGSEPIHFDVRHEKCILYPSIRSLAGELSRLIAALYPDMDSRVPVRPARKPTGERSWVHEGVRARDGILTLDLPLSLEPEASDTVLAGLRELDPEGHRGLIINLSDPDRMTSTGLDGLLSLWKALSRRGQRVAVVPPHRADEAFRTLLGKMIRPTDVYPDEEAAFQAIRQVT